MSLRVPAMWVWAAREAARRPAESLLTGAALAAVVTVFGAALLLAQALEDTAAEVLRDAPSLVVRRAGPGGWAPMPSGSPGRLREVRGIPRAEGRVWGVARLGESVVTVVAVDSRRPGAEGMDVDPLARGQVEVGASIDRGAGDPATLLAATSLEVQVRARRDAEGGLVDHDLVLMHPDDARRLLGLAPGTFSDVAVWVFHDSEIEAVRPDLSAALSFPVTLTSADERLGSSRAQIDHAAGLRVTLLVPALLALTLLVAAGVRIELSGRRELALLKSLGWTTGDLVRLHGLRALMVALPAVSIGAAAAYGLVFVPELGWLSSWIYGWVDGGPVLVLTTEGAALTLLEVVAIALGPYLVAILLPLLRQTAVDPEEWLGEEA